MNARAIPTPLTLSTRQAHELSRVAARHGPLAVRPPAHGALLVALAGHPGITVALRLDSTGRVRGLRAAASSQSAEAA